MVSTIVPVLLILLSYRFLATGHTYTDLGYAFRVAVPTLSKLIPRTLQAIWSALCPIHMKVPSKNDFKKSAAAFASERDIPHTLGAIDGRHIRIRKPNLAGTKYHNYKGYHSIVLLAVVDAFYRFMAIDVGGYGSQHDGGSFAASEFYKAVDENLLEFSEKSTLPGSDFELPYFFEGVGYETHRRKKFAKKYSYL